VLHQELQMKVHARDGDFILHELCKEMKSLESRLKESGQTSQLALINSEAGRRSIAVDQSLYNLIEKSVNLAHVSGGLYDPTAKPLYSLWRRYRAFQGSPSRDEVYRVLEKVDYRSIGVHSDTKEVFLTRKDMELDLSALVDGYCIDVCVEEAMRFDIIGAVVHMGNTYRFIKRRGGESLDVLMKPVIRDAGGQGILTLRGCENRALALTEPAGGLILNPLDGYPVRSNLTSIAVIGPDAVTADALSMIFAAGGLKSGMQLVNDMPFFEAVVVDSRKNIMVSRNGSRHVEEPAPGYRLVVYAQK